MKYTLRILAATGMIAGLCSGCKKEEKVTPAEVEQPKAKVAKDWEPETAAPAAHAHDPNDGGDHSGHNH